MYRLVSQPNPQLPRLAWCAVVNPAAGTVEVAHGAAIAGGDDFLVEGAWEGEFAAGGFPTALLATGSGIKITAQGVAFTTPSHNLEANYSARVDGQVYFSNSLSFVLASAGLTLRADFPHYLSILSSSRFGCERYTRAIPTVEGVDVAVHLHCNATVDDAGRITSARRPIPDAFRDYQQFRAFCIESLQALRDNAQAAGRPARFGLMSTISSGYDSVAVSVLAHQIGCTEALTFTDAVGGADDSGARIAERLGMHVHRFQRGDCRESLQGVVDVVACGDSDIQFAACEELLGDKLLLTGYFGDTLWGLHYKSVWGKPTNTPLVRTDSAGISLKEFRLRAGFLHVPLPLFALARDRSVWQISHSAEMAPWRLGGSYDRPIPRRIAEDAGIPREWFGQQKRVAVMSFTPSDSTLHPTLAEDYRRYVHQHACRTTAPAHNAAARVVYLSRRFARLLDRYHLLPPALRYATHVAPPVPIRYLYPVDERSYTVPWAIGKLRDHYAQALRSGAEIA